MKFLVIFIGTIAIVQSSVIHYSHQLNTPVEITNVVGPSGSIKQEKYLDSLSHPTEAKTTVTSLSTGNDDCVHGNGVVHSSINVLQGFNRNEQLLQLNPSPIVHLNSPALVQYKAPTNIRIGTSYVTNDISAGLTKSSIIGPSGAITQEIVSNSNTLSAQVPVIQKTIPAVVKPVIVHRLPSVQNTVVTHGTKLVYAAPEKTSVIGPVSYISQGIASKYNKYAHEVNYIVKNAPAAVNVAVGQYGFPSAYSGGHSYTTKTVSLPLEKTRVVGSSGLITQEKYVDSLPNTFGYEIIRQDRPVQLHYASPLIQNVGVISYKNTPVHTTYTVERNSPVSSAISYDASPISVHHGLPLTQNLNVVSGNNGVDRTSIVGPSGSITQENNSKSILTHVSEVSDLPTPNVAVPYTFVKHTAPTITIANENIQSYGPYPPASKYPIIAAPDC